MRVLIESVGADVVFRATGEGSGQTIVVDARHGDGVVPEGPRPMELLAMGLGGCLVDNVVVILKKKRVPFIGVRMDIEADRAPESPKRFTALRLRCVVEAEGLTQEALDKVLELAAKYCSAHATLTQGVPITTVAAIEAPASPAARP